jgi:hypothetical protein
MNTKMSALGSPKVDATRRVGTWTPIVAVAGVVIVLAAVLPSPAMRAKAEQLKAEQIDQENRTLCEKIGMLPGSERFAACASVLSEVRKRQAERFAAEMGNF